MQPQPTYTDLLRENERLRQENKHLRQQLARFLPSEAAAKVVKAAETTEPLAPPVKPAPRCQLSLEEKVKLFQDLFTGRNDVFARRWHSTSSGKSGYHPVCLNEWHPELCDKKKYKCADCPHRKLKTLSYEDLYRHLEGRDPLGRDVVGLYPVRSDNTCSLLCADFDDKSCEHGYEKDVLAYVSAARQWGIESHIERSRSGNGAHVWIFFSEPVPAAQARQLGNALLTEAMKRRGQLSLKSYDRLFPNQDTLTDGGFGNLIALPLQGQARKKGNSVFVDETFRPVEDQWSYLQQIRKITPFQIETILRNYTTASELGPLSTTTESKPWETPAPIAITQADFTAPVTLVRANMLYIPLDAVSAKVVNHLKRIAAFRNPDFYAKRAMHFSTHNVPRIISCSEITDTYIGLPRGCEDAVISLLQEQKIPYKIQDKTTAGHAVSVRFKGELRPEQNEAVQALLHHRNGILHATTAFGKTVTAIGLIARKKVNTLILVHNKALLNQWKERLETFLDVDYSEPNEPRRGRKRKFSPFGTLDSSGNTLHGHIDIALIQSCMEDSDNGIKDFVRKYAMVMVDECHHIPAAGFEQVMRRLPARYVYGLTATPIRKDGAQPIIFMQCGSIRYTAPVQKQMETQSFARILHPRFTSFRLPDNDKILYASLADKLSEDEIRNRLILDDTLKAVAEGRTPLILTTLTKHVLHLAETLQKENPNLKVISLIGSEKVKEKREKLSSLNTIQAGEPMVIVATGKYIGEGFDYPRLDTLMLALPVSWKGIVQQYAGRLHREYPGKKEVGIYDYIDLHIPLAELMYRRRMKGYAAIGYNLSDPFQEKDTNTPERKIFNGEDYFDPYLDDLQFTARQSIVIIMPKLWFPKNNPFLDLLQEKQAQGLSVTVFTQQETPATHRLQAKGIPVKITPAATVFAAILDTRLVWYGAVHYLAKNLTEEYAIRLHDPHLATELLTLVS